MHNAKEQGGDPWSGFGTEDEDDVDKNNSQEDNVADSDAEYVDVANRQEAATDEVSDCNHFLCVPLAHFATRRIPCVVLRRSIWEPS